MARQEITLQNFVGGQLSPNMNGRYDTVAHRNGLRRAQNFLPLPQGPAHFRTGFSHVFPTRLNQIAHLFLFEYNDEEAYQIEATNGKFRFYRNEEIITETGLSITAITQADPGVVTTATHSYTTGDQVIIEGVEGMYEVSGRNFLITVLSPTTFSLQDIDGNDVDTTAFGAWTSAGTSSKVYEIDTPYTEVNDLFEIRVTQNANTMYLTHKYHEPRKLTRTDHNNWTLELYTRTADPFLLKKTITAITQANPGVVTATGHNLLDGDLAIIETVAGMTEVNGLIVTVTNKTANTYELYDLAGNAIDTTAFTGYSSGGYTSDSELLPSTVTFHESRLFFAGMVVTPEKIISSRTPDSSGVTRYEDFTTGTDDDHSVRFTIADAEVNKILWLTGTDKVLLVGTFGSEVRVSGTDLDKSITPSSVQARPINRIGVANINPVNRMNAVFYVQRGDLTLTSLAYSALLDGYEPLDRNLISTDVTVGGIKSLAWQTSRPDILWAVRNDGKLLALTVEDKEQISAWSVHTTGTNGGDDFLDVSVQPRSSGFEQVWVVVERIVQDALGANVTHRYVEFMADDPVIPQQIEYFTGTANETADETKFLLDLAETQKDYTYVDSFLTYNGAARGTSYVATITPGATTGTGISFTSDNSVFRSSDVGREIWKKAIEGVGTGRAEITAYVSPTEVTCSILTGADFDVTTAMAPGNWYLTASSIINLHHLEGRTATVVADGGKHTDEVVTGGAVTLDYQASVIHIGLGYEGILQPMNIELGGGSGPAQTKMMHINKIGIRFQDSLGAEIGSDLYNLEEVLFTSSPLYVGGPGPLFSGVKSLTIPDSWEEEKVIYIRQGSPAPCKVQLLALHGETDDD
jgi:hypothetical protein